MQRLIERRRSSIHGNGVFAVCAIAENMPVCRYGGKRISHEEADARYAGDLASGHTFLFTLNDDYVIDANQDGNIARWINHSCEPNCQALMVESPGSDRRRDQIEIHTLRALEPGEELTYDYGIRLAVPHTAKMKKYWACHCGAPTCTGTMLKPKR